MMICKVLKNEFLVEKIPVVMRPLGSREAIFLSLTGKLIDRQDFIRNLFNRSYFLQVFLRIILL